MFLIYAASSADGLVLVFIAKVDAARQLVKGFARGAGDSYFPPAEGPRRRGAELRAGVLHLSVCLYLAETTSICRQQSRLTCGINQMLLHCCGCFIPDSPLYKMMVCMLLSQLNRGNRWTESMHLVHL